MDKINLGRNPKSKPRIASAPGAGQAAPRLLHSATALTVTPPLRFGSRRPVWPKGSFRPGHGPKRSRARSGEADP